MGNIVLLDDLTINKIAAGEVIERPASVVKEMVENSIDAGSKNITIEIKNGGISYIKITDDGSGISEDDLEIAFERHATSKIRSSKDLETVMTMGFRGEALASIAAISHIEMVSKKQDDEIGHKIVVEGGKILEKTEIGCPTGTSITVSNLFFNTPVRYKFLKKDYTESGYIEDAVKRIALVNKDVAIKLISSGKTIVQTNGSGDIKDIIYSIYGKDITNGVKEVNYMYEDIKITGVVGSADIARANRQNQIFFVNGRYVRDKNLISAVDQSYKDIIPAGKFAFVILNLEINPQKLDVNVHPAKLEVRFEDENQIFKAVYNAIKNVFGKEVIIENKDFYGLNQNNISLSNEKKTEPELDMKKDLTIQERINIINEMINKITPEKTVEGTYKVPEESKKVEKSFSSNVLEAVYRDRLSRSSVPEKRIDYDEVGRTINFGNTQISSNTQEINVIEINNKLNEEKLVQEPVLEKKVLEKQEENISSEDIKQIDFPVEEKKEIEETQKLSVIEKINKEIQEEIQKVDVIADTEMKETPTVIEDKNDETNILGDNENEYVAENDDNELANSQQLEEKKDEFISEVAEKLVEAKLNDFDSTEMIDTNQVKKVVKETFSNKPEFAKMYKETFGVEISSSEEDKKDEKLRLETESLDLSEAETVTDINQSLFEEMYKYQKIDYKFIGVAFSSYIIIEIKDDMYMIDEQAAQERVLFEEIKRTYYENRDSQLLLIPDIISVDSKQMDIARENKEMFRKAGFEFEEFGDNTIKLTSVPSICENLNTKKVLLELLSELDTVAVTENAEKEIKFIATLAYRITENMQMELDMQEIEILLEQLLKLPNPFVSHGKKSVAIKMSKYDLDRKFSRR